MRKRLYQCAIGSEDNGKTYECLIQEEYKKNQYDPFCRVFGNSIKQCQNRVNEILGKSTIKTGDLVLTKVYDRRRWVKATVDCVNLNYDLTIDDVCYNGVDESKVKKIVNRRNK